MLMHICMLTSIFQNPVAIIFIIFLLFFLFWPHCYWEYIPKSNEVNIFNKHQMFEKKKKSKW